MKTLSSALLIVCFTIITLQNTFSQDWQWKWADKTATNHQSDIITYMMHCDFHNNTYSLIGYESAVYFEDTALFHGPSTYNSVFVKYDSAGNIGPPLDLWVNSQQNVFNPRLVTDQDLNIYIGGSFAQGFNIQDTSFTFVPGNSSFHPEVFIVKLSPDYDIKWSKLISGTWSDQLMGMIVNSSDEIIIATEHVCSPQYPTTVIYLNQDTVTYSNDFNSITKIDSDGEMQWRNEIHGNIHQLHLTAGKDGLIYYTGYSGGNISFSDGSILTYPWGANYMWANFIITFNQDGELVESRYLHPQLRFYHFDVDTEGNKYLSWVFSDTLLIGTDTIIAPEEASWNYFAKLNPSVDQAFWYHIIPRQDGQTVNSFNILQYENRVFFSTTANKNLVIDNNIIPLGLKKKGVFGEFSENGDLVNITSIGSQFQLNIFNSLMDNCGNLVAGGMFNGQAIFGHDTLKSYLNANMDAFVAKLQIAEPINLNLGNDTTVCDGYTIYAPEGYYTYIWNDSITNQNWINVNETGMYVLQCATESGCWLHDSIYIEVHPGIVMTLPSDMLVCIDDSIAITVDGAYQSYLWSTGDTTNSISIIAMDLGTGQHWLSLEVTDGPCYFIDSLSITVHPAIDINLPMDTLLCSDDLFCISVPDNYEAYYWSTGNTTNSICIEAEELGIGQNYIGLDVLDGPCYFSDSISVYVHPKIEITLSNDTLIRIYDTLAIEVPGGFEHYEWSTGDTTSSIAIPAREMGVGSHWIYLTVIDGPCFFSDSLSLYVQSDFGINGPNDQRISIVPNPANDHIIITAHQAIEQVEICNIYGKLVMETSYTNSIFDKQIIDISHLDAGLLIVRVRLSYGSITKKIIKI